MKESAASSDCELCVKIQVQNRERRRKHIFGILLHCPKDNDVEGSCDSQLANSKIYENTKYETAGEIFPEFWAQNAFFTTL